MTRLVCWNCGGSLDDIPRPISRHSYCSHCFNELHCCRLCRHYDPKRNMQCFEDRADPPLQKENANFCDFFAPRANAFAPRTASKSQQARGDLDALFNSQLDKQPDEQQASASADAAEGEQPDGEVNHKPEQTLSADELAKKKLDDLFN